MKTFRDIIRGHISSLSVRRYKAARRRNSKTLRQWTWDATDNLIDLRSYMNNEKENKIFLGVSDFNDLITSEVLLRRTSSGKKTVHRETTVLCNRATWSAWSEKHFAEFLFVQGSGSAGFIIEESTDNYIMYTVNSNSTCVRVYGDVDFCETLIDIIEENFDVVTSHIEWIYDADGSSASIPLNRDRLPIDEMYPFLNGESLGSYYDRYMASSANILLLIGPPGTGKTTFIRGFLSHTNSSAIATYDARILEKDYVFAKFIEDDMSVMVLEDSDAFLKPRSDGNTMMHRFLNVGDGLVTTKGKKMIFSTNLPSIRDIDSALIRPGRCFDILTFDPLNVSDAQVLADKLNITLPVKPQQGSQTTGYSISEIYHQQNHPISSVLNRRVGFV